MTIGNLRPLTAFQKGVNALNGLVVDPKIKIVIVTAYTEYKSEELLNIAEKGDLCFFRKPFTLEEITQLADMLIDEWGQDRKNELN